MSFETNLRRASEALTQSSEEELSLEESAKIYKTGLESIEETRLEFKKAKLEVGKIDE